MTYHIAAVSFLNTIPLIDHLTDPASGDHQLYLDLPSRLAARLESGEADVALLPVAEAFRGRCGGILAGTGIACRGAVDSVKFFCQGSPRDLTSVLVDRGSTTSVALLRVLLQELHGVAPVFQAVEPEPGWQLEVNQGALVIGDRCFAFEKALGDYGPRGIVAIDLGQAWLELTGLPFIFAAWAVSAEFCARASTAEVAALVGLLTTARDQGLSRLDELAAREAAQGKLGHKGEATPEAVAYYFRESLRYRLGDEEMAGLARFHELCIKHGIVPDGPAPLILRG